MSTLTDAPTTGSRAADPAPSHVRIAAALARVEGLRALRHPATIVGVLLSTALAIVWVGQEVPILQRDVVTLAFMAVPFAAGVLVAGHLAASRLRRDEVLPLAELLPATDDARTAGLLLAQLWPAAAAVAWSAVGLIVARMAGGIGSPAAGDVAAPFGLVLLAGVTGVALGRWLPWTLVGAAALPVLAAVGGVAFERALAVGPGPVAQRLLPWADWSSPLGALIETYPRQPWLHLSHVLLAAGVIAAVALLRDRRHLVVAVAGAACAAGVTVTSVTLLAVWDDDEHLATLVQDVTDPDHRRVCTTEAALEVCMVTGYEAWEPLVRDEATIALRAVPDAALSQPVRVVQWTQPPQELLASLPRHRLDEVPPALTAAATAPFDPLQLPRMDRDAAIASSWRGRGQDAGRLHLDLALGVVGQVTGWPVDDWARVRGAEDPNVPGAANGCVPPMLAAEVLAFALVAHADPALRAALESELQASPYGWYDMGGGAVFDDALLLSGGANTVTPEARNYQMTSSLGPWSRGAATLGLALADRTEPTELYADWDRWVDPATDAEALADAFGLDPLHSPAELADEAGLALVPFDPRCT